ncbi:hypothetical protein Nepgr_011408 [Nepenthes gracilis]|uniref:Uncharacterized protein n=1 Tax=Nepenthes gracilis TaxID=150966 RepID=A0AAD3XLY5_NEPGR|nr:hypothetical protein Nepgr_011408 [Nepenthes gracilis]
MVNLTIRVSLLLADDDDGSKVHMVGEAANLFYIQSLHLMFYTGVSEAAISIQADVFFIDCYSSLQPQHHRSNPT